MAIKSDPRGEGELLDSQKAISAVFFFSGRIQCQAPKFRLSHHPLISFRTSFTTPASTGPSRLLTTLRTGSVLAALPILAPMKVFVLGVRAFFTRNEIFPKYRIFACHLYNSSVYIIFWIEVWGTYYVKTIALAFLHTHGLAFVKRFGARLGQCRRSCEEGESEY